jgi:creatinine amidohydrolase
MAARAVLCLLERDDGHNQQIVVRETAVRMSERLQIPVLGTPEYWLAHDAGYLGDHAGIGETSLLWHLEPELVRIDRIRSDPDYGRDDWIEKGASPERGRRYAELIMSRLARLARAMPGWDSEKLAAFVRAERGLVTARVRGWRSTGNAWAAWSRISPGGETGYGELLVNEQFTEIEAMAARLAMAEGTGRAQRPS